MSTSFKNAGKQALKSMLEIGQKFGVSVTPHHFYSEIPDFAEMRRDERWRNPYSMVGVQGGDVAPQLAFVEQTAGPHRDRLTKGGIHSHAIAQNGAVGYGPGEASFLYSFIATHRPARVVQVGCGVSTAVILLAAGECGYTPEIICVEPYPTDYLVRLANEKKINLVREKAQHVDLRVLTDLGPDGFLFVDSTHTLRPGSEVNRLILEVLPRLKKGDWVHFHDIYFPHDFSPTILGQDLFFRHESILLHGFLACNARYEIKAALSMLHHANAGRLRELLVDYRPAPTQRGIVTGEGDFPSAAYLRVVG